ncbi:hypothetical protein [Flavobacterium sp.]|uniref:hypothetical protein n=1 Tax=Flavobacterium sp. TaxID=239 RepID=UPI0035279758
MESNSKNSGLKAAVVILSLLLLASIGYIYKLTTDNTAKSTEIESLAIEKENLTNDLKARIAELDKMTEENTSLKQDIEEQKAEMTKLLKEIEQSKGDAASMARYKNEYFRLKREMESLVAENKLLKENNIKLTSSIDSTNVVLTDTRKFADTLLTQNDNLTKTVLKGQKLTVLNLNVVAVKERNSGKQIETDKARRADKLKIAFIIAENQIAEEGARKYYVQVIDSRNNVLGEKKTIAMGNDLSLTYSFLKNIEYHNKTVEVQEEISGDNFEAGNYFVNVFNEKGENVSKTSFVLR